MIPQPPRNKKKSRILKFLGLNSIIEIASDYASEGGSLHSKRAPPLEKWIATLGRPAVLSAVLAAIPYPCGCTLYSFDIDAQPNDVALTLIPSLLGFGIGAYALIFGLNGDLLKKIQSEYNKKEEVAGIPVGSVLSINSSFAFPLMLMAITLILAIIQKTLPDIQILATAVWFLTFFCLILTCQLLIGLYRLGIVIILEKF